MSREIDNGNIPNQEDNGRDQVKSAVNFRKGQIIRRRGTRVDSIEQILSQHPTLQEMLKELSEVDPNAGMRPEGHELDF